VKHGPGIAVEERVKSILYCATRNLIHGTFVAWNVPKEEQFCVLLSGADYLGHIELIC
jgi:hypothetical protein